MDLASPPAGAPEKPCDPFSVDPARLMLPPPDPVPSGDPSCGGGSLDDIFLLNSEQTPALLNDIDVESVVGLRGFPDSIPTDSIWPNTSDTFPWTDGTSLELNHYAQLGPPSPLLCDSADEVQFSISLEHESDKAARDDLHFDDFLLPPLPDFNEIEDAPGDSSILNDFINLDQSGAATPLEPALPTPRENVQSPSWSPQTPGASPWTSMDVELLEVRSHEGNNSCSVEEMINKVLGRRREDLDDDGAATPLKSAPPTPRQDSRSPSWSPPPLEAILACTSPDVESLAVSHHGKASPGRNQVPSRISGCRGARTTSNAARANSCRAQTVIKNGRTRQGLGRNEGLRTASQAASVKERSCGVQKEIDEILRRRAPGPGRRRRLQASGSRRHPVDVDAL
ncbi:hypothetical protein GGTG_13446 [Gaeumannomyces tritici R3-111a-1]|uniref:Uncharacterized protein n=1 Tax=Gaeumannomyces tritici (strain R3-111a-1) TaxID=644352 RepID=J3PIW6_GAET3|nr:hypothetical protein GGTG_13446 [Gaeumannomyces tritici R3-111a-1]EJT69049.1 hypothetical protein GGTG_13446 [Gaeumannomyces tritici R3-111a-1]